MPHPWSERGYRLRSIVKASAALRPEEDLPELDRLDDDDRDVVKVHLEDLLFKVEQLLNHLHDDDR